jgi:hypothetical protein
MSEARLTGHLDSNEYEHHDAYVRTTVTLDKDVERMLREEMHRSRRSFKEALNGSIRLGLSGKGSKITPKRFKVNARALKSRAGIDPISFNKLVDELEVDAFLKKSQIARK